MRDQDGDADRHEHQSVKAADWLTVIATGRWVGVTPESTVTQYPRPGVLYRPLRDAPPVPVRLPWWRDDPPPVATAVAGLLRNFTEGDLYRGR